MGQGLTGDGKFTEIDNVSVRLAEDDRSVKNKGLQVFGTVPKQPVATGAELVSYGPFSNADYLEQSFDEDFEYGTGDFSVSLWFKTTGSGYIDVSNSGGFVLPVGTGADRPTTPLLGMIRYNTNDERVELYDGSQWGSIAGSSGAVSIIDATEIAVQIAVTLG